MSVCARINECQAVEQWDAIDLMTDTPKAFFVFETLIMVSGLETRPIGAISGLEALEIDFPLRGGCRKRPLAGHIIQRTLLTQCKG